MRLLRAELRKLRRPLVMWTCLATLGLIGLIDYQQIANVGQQLFYANQIGEPIPTSCEGFDLPPGPECDRQLALMKQGFCQSNGVPEGASVIACLPSRLPRSRRRKRPTCAS